MPTTAVVACPNCHAVFEPRRRNQKYCNDNCRKATYQKKDRAENPKNSFHSAETRRSNTERFDRLMVLTEDYYATKPDDRLGFLKDIVDRARAGDTALRAVLCNRYFLGAGFTDLPWLFFRKSWAYPNIAKAANRYCRVYWGAGVIDVVHNRVPEPETGEVVGMTGHATIAHDPDARQNVASIIIREQNVVSIVIGKPDGRTMTGPRDHETKALPEYAPVPLSDLQRHLRSIPEYQKLLTQFIVPKAA